MKKLICIGFALASVFTGVAQDDLGYNPNSVRPIQFAHIMYKKSIIRSLDLREKQNLPLYSSNRELVKILIDAVQAGLVDAYKNDSLDLGTKLTLDEFNEKLKEPSAQAELTDEEKSFMEANTSDDGFGAVDMSNIGPSYFTATQLYKVEIKEDLIFDKQRSRMYFDILSITIKVPSEYDPRGIEGSVACFKYKDLVEKVFKKNPNAVWFNQINDAEHKNLADAFDLRLFSSKIIKVSNPKDEYLEDIYNETPKQGLLASIWTEHELMEYEHNLWEF